MPILYVDTEEQQLLENLVKSYDKHLRDTGRDAFVTETLLETIREAADA